MMTGRRALVIGAPHSGSGKTFVTLGLLRALKAAGHAPHSAKSGPDYIDPGFHRAATGAPCFNLDAWAMDDQTLRSRLYRHTPDDCLIVVEGAMGLFDGAANGVGSTADVAASLQSPVILVVDAARQAQSVAALVSGFSQHRQDVHVAAVILNRVASARHEAMLRKALGAIGMEVAGAVPSMPDLSMPSRHLGLVQAGEMKDLEAFVDKAAQTIAANIDLDRMASFASPVPKAEQRHRRIEPLGNHIAIARDTAFAFCYPHMVSDWQDAGSKISYFSPLADEGPPVDCDSVFLPGGYPELHADQIAAGQTFRAAMQKAAADGKTVYGECGGFMVLGNILVDATGREHSMLGLLPLTTSFAARKRHLGYRQLDPLVDVPFDGRQAAHEFHYSSVVHEGGAARLFQAFDAEDKDLGTMGLRHNTVFGSFAHIIAAAG